MYRKEIEATEGRKEKDIRENFGCCNKMGKKDGDRRRYIDRGKQIQSVKEVHKVGRARYVFLYS